MGKSYDEALDKDDPILSINSFVTADQLKEGRLFRLVGGDGVERTLLQTESGFNGKQGIYEYILDPSDKITHQRFIEGGVINGIPNQKPIKGGG